MRPFIRFLLLALTGMSAATAWAAEFRVADFGAAGDGKNDDAPAARQALKAAVEAGPGSKVVFESKTYRFARQQGDAILALDGVKGITLEGNGAEIMGNPWNGFLRISDCKDITMRGFVIDCDPASFTQGDIIEVEPDKGSLVMQLDDGYANPVELEERLGRMAWERVGFTLDPVKRRIKPGPVDSIESITELNRGKGLLQVRLKAARFDHIRVGDHFVFGLHYGSHGALIKVERSSGIRLEDHTIHGGRFGMNHSFSDNHGRVHVKGAKIAFRPETNRLVTSIKDGFHVKHNRIGPIIEDCVLEGMMDDAINISVCPYWVKEDLGEKRYLIAEVAFSPRVGDRLMAYTPVPGTVSPELKVLAVEPSKAHQSRREKWNVITLDRPIPDLALHEGGNLFPGGTDKLRFTGLYNLDACGKDYIVRNNRFLPQRRHALLARAPGGLFEGNEVVGVGGEAVYLGNETGSFYEGPFPANTIIRNNSFRETGRHSIRVGAKGRNVWARNITIEHNTFSGWPDSAMHLSRIRGGIIRNNRIGPGGAEGKSPVPMVIRQSSEIRIEKNSIRDPRPALTAAIDLSNEFDAPSSVISGNQVALAPDFPMLMQIIPPISVQPRGQKTRPLKAGDETGALLRAASMKMPDGRMTPVWMLHPVWKGGLRGALLYELQADLTRSSGIRFSTRSATGRGDGVAMTVEWKPLGAADSAYKPCHQGTIRGKDWTDTAVKVDSAKARVMLRFHFDCGPAKDAGYDTVELTGLDLLGE